MRSVVGRNVVMRRIPVLTVLYSFLSMCVKTKYVSMGKTSGRKRGLFGVLSSACPLSATIVAIKFTISVIYGTGSL